MEATAALEAKPEQLTEEARFYAKCMNQVLTKEPARYPHRTPDGTVFPGSEGVRVEFEDHEYGTYDPAIADWLRNHKGFGSTFWEHGRAPDEPQPTTDEQIKKIVWATREQDGNALAALIEEEKATHNREPVLKAASEALDALSDDDDSPDTPLP